MNKKMRWLMLLTMVVLAQLTLIQVPIAHADVPAGCVELVRNGSFETLFADWASNLGANPTPVYDNGFKIDGAQSVRLGITNNGNPVGKSEISQEITLPADALSIVLTYRFFMVYTGAADGGDMQTVDLTNVAAPTESVTLINEASNSTQWRMDQRPLTANRGQTLRLTFGVSNNGGTGRAGMYVDGVSIIACNTITATATITPTHTPTPTATSNVPTFTPTPTNTGTPLQVCEGAELLLNGGFETDNAWYFGEDPLPGRYVGTQKHGGNRSVLLGSLPGSGLPDLYSYSSIRQLVTIPANATSVQLRWWHLYGTEDPDYPHEPCQQVILLSPDLKTLRTIRNLHSNEGTWNVDAADLSDLRGQSFYIYFNALNDGDGRRTWMYIDDVSVRACFPSAKPVNVVAQATASGPIPTEIPIAPLNQPAIQAPAANPQVIQAPIVNPSVLAEVPTATGVALAPLGDVAPAANARVSAPLAETPVAEDGGLFATPTPASAGWFWNLFGGGNTQPVEVPVESQGASSVQSQGIEINRLGTVAVLLGILVIIALLAMAIVRMLRGR